MFSCIICRVNIWRLNRVESILFFTIKIARGCLREVQIGINNIETMAFRIRIMLLLLVPILLPSILSFAFHLHVRRMHIIEFQFCFLVYTAYTHINYTRICVLTYLCIYISKIHIYIYIYVYIYNIPITILSAMIIIDLCASD